MKKSKAQPEMNRFKSTVYVEATNTFSFQAATKKPAEEIALDTATQHAKRLDALGWDVEVNVLLMKNKRRGQVSPLSYSGIKKTPFTRSRYLRLSQAARSLSA